jgi:hypothetical protein
VASFTNRAGVTYYLHEGKTSTGKPRYFVARNIRDGALARLPAGYEFAENINGAVSVRRVVATSPVLDADLAFVRTELDRHHHLSRYRAEVERGSIVVFEPLDGLDAALLRELTMGMAPGDSRRPKTRYQPVLKFVSEPDPGVYSVHRMTYVGAGGWSWALATGQLRRVTPRFIKVLGTDEFFTLL